MKYFWVLLGGALLFLLLPSNGLAQTPVFTITVSTEEADNNPIYFASVNHLAIISNTGEYLFLRKVEGENNTGTDFKRQGDRLTYFVAVEDRIRSIGFGRFEEMDTSYTVTRTWEGVGELADWHDLQYKDNGNAVLLLYRSRTMDLTSLGGSATATVYSCVVQELDANNNLVWEWDSYPGIPITNTVLSVTGDVVDYAHCNAVDIDNDGNYLVSNRNLSSITKVDGTTGDIIWQLGGVANEFTFTNDDGFNLQHDIRRLDNGRITMFDNGVASRGYSRGVEYEIDEVNMIITKTWEHTGTFTFCCGNMQTLDNGNRLISWGFAKPSVTEVKPDGTRVFVLEIHNNTYRAYKMPAPPFDWQVTYMPVIMK